MALKNQIKDDVYCCPTAREKHAIDAMARLDISGTLRKAIE